MKRIVLVMIASFVFMFSNLAVNAADPTIEHYQPNDMTDHWAVDSIDNFVQSDLLKGYGNSDGTYSVKPNDDIKRAAFLTILVRSLNAYTGGAGKKFLILLTIATK